MSTNENLNGESDQQPAARPHRVRRGLPWIGLLVLVALIIAGLWPKPVPVEIGQATIGPLRATVTEEGKTRIRQRYMVSAPFAGQLRRIPFKAGAEVKAGETVVAVLDPLPPAPLDARVRALTEARRDVAAANLEKARASQEFAASELKRFERLSAEKTISVQELEGAQWREKNAAKELSAAESALRQVEAELAEFAARSDAAQRAPLEIHAPVSGKVLRVLEENARVVASGTPLVEIGNPAELEIVIDVLSRDGAGLAPGTPVELEQWGGGPPLEARVRLVEPAAFTKISALGVEEQRVNVIADLITPYEKRTGLGDNFRVDAHIVVWRSDDALKVPTGALFRKGDAWAAFKVIDGRAQLQLVEAGRSSGTETHVVNGLKAGDPVILYPSSRVQNGVRIKKLEL